MTLLRDRRGFDVVRYAPAGTVRAASTEADADGPDEGVLYGHFSVFNRWYEIDSPWEGNFMERILPGAFRQTFAEDVQRCWFEHGQSPLLGRASLGAIEVLREDKVGAYYEVRLFDGLPAIILEGLRAGEYGASFRMRIFDEQVNTDPGVSEHNPKGLPEVSIAGIRSPEFGPVCIGANPGATAALRCATDDFYAALRSSDPEAYAQAVRAAEQLTIPTVGADTEGAADGGSGSDATPTTNPDRGRAALSRLIDAGIPLQ